MSDIPEITSWASTPGRDGLEEIRIWDRVMPDAIRPRLGDRCSWAGCAHRFGDHYWSFGGGAVGCAYRADGETGTPCPCVGFLVAFVYGEGPIGREKP